MNRYLFFAFIYFFIPAGAFAQAPFNTADSVNINRINARVLVHGDMFWNPELGVAACEFPQGSGKHINFACALWMSGYDNSGQLHVAAQTYRQTGNDYWPGPLTSDTLTYANSQNWANIWKVNNSDIQTFLGLTTHTTINTPQSILTWPGKGNINAAGNGGVPLTIANGMAPFVDLNGNGIYEPLLGEYPDIKGDQALWWVFSDNGPSHTSSKGKPFGVEIHAMAYAYNRGTLIDNVIYFDYNIINRSPNTYNNTRIGLWDDIDLGWYYDDYIGFDSSHRMGIQYNGNNNDGGGGGSPVNSYGTHVPMVGMTMIVLPGDSGTTYVPAGSFVYYNNDASIIGGAALDTQDNYSLRGKSWNGTSIANYMPATNHCRDHDTNQFYCFTGDPSDAGQCSECVLNNNPGDRRFILASNDFSLNSGNSRHIVIALVTTNPDTLNGCPGASFDNIKTVADTAWANYYNPPPQTAVKNISINNSISIYPNPAFNELYIVNSNSTGDEYIAIYNSLGQKIYLPITKKNTGDIIDVSSLPPALYYIVYRKDHVQKTAKFIKE